MVGMQTTRQTMSQSSANQGKPMNSRIIYPTDDGGVAVIIPTAECGLTIQQIAAKDVPMGKPYKIVDVSDVPSDRVFRNAWSWQD